MTLNLKKRRKADACDAQRCKQRSDITVVTDLELGNFKLCKKHLAEWNESKGGDETPPTPEETQAGFNASHDAVLAIVEPIRVEAADMLPQIRAIVLTNQAGLDAAGALLQATKGKAKSLEVQRTSVTKPLLDAKRGIDSWFKPARDALNSVELALKGAISAYVEQQRAAQVAALQAGEHATALATEQPTMPAGVSTRTVWRFEIVDPEAVPREFLVIDGAKIAQHVTAHKGNTSIPGIRVYADTDVSSTSAAAS